MTRRAGAADGSLVQQGVDEFAWQAVRVVVVVRGERAAPTLAGHDHAPPAQEIREGPLLVTQYLPYGWNTVTKHEVVQGLRHGTVGQVAQGPGRVVTRVFCWNGLRNPLRRSADIASGCLVGPRQITPSARILRILDEIEIKELKLSRVINQPCFATAPLPSCHIS